MWGSILLPELARCSPDRDIFAVMDDVLVEIDCRTADELTGIIVLVVAAPIDAAADGEFIVYTVE